LILPDPTAIGIMLSHGSRTPPATWGRGVRLSSTRLIYPWEGYNPGKLGLISHRRATLEWVLIERAWEHASASPKDEAVFHQVVGEVTARQADNGCGQ